MASIEEVAENVYRLEVPISALTSAFGVYLIHGAEGIVIEPGPSIAARSIQEGMQHLGMKDLACIIPTHLHVDHAGGIGTLARLYTGAKVLVHPKGAKHAIDPSRLIESTRKAWGDNFEVDFGPILPVAESQVKVVEDGEIVSVNDRDFEIIHAPGHAPHQMVIFDRKSGGIFCGDALGMLAHVARPFPLPNTAPPNFDQELYLATIERLGQLGAKILFYSHGGVQHEADTLISMAAENTRVFSNIALAAIKEGATLEATAHRIREHVAGHSGLELDRTDLEMVVSGYAFYFHKKGLV